MSGFVFLAASFVIRDQELPGKGILIIFLLKNHFRQKLFGKHLVRIVFYVVES
jgi:hypothetical protein